MLFRSSSSEPPKLTEDEEALLRKLAEKIVGYRMTVPAILFLESVKPLNFIGSQIMVFFEPFVHIFFTLPDYERLAIILEKRDNVERLIEIIEETDAEDAHARAKKKDKTHGD